MSDLGNKYQIGGYRAARNCGWVMIVFGAVFALAAPGAPDIETMFTAAVGGAVFLITGITSVRWGCARLKSQNE